MENTFTNNYTIKTNLLYGTTESNTPLSKAKGVFRWANNQFIPVTKMVVGKGASSNAILVWEAIPTEGGGEDTSSVTANIEQAYWSGNEIYYFITFEGIESYLDYITVEVNSDYYGDGNIYGEVVTHETIIHNDSATGSITVYNQTSPLYIVVRDSSNKVIGSQIIE